MANHRKDILWAALVAVLTVFISLLHYTTPTMNWQLHLIFMQSYFIPILIAAFQFGVRGGVGAAILVSVLYLPHIMLQWGGLVEANLMRFLQIFLFYIIGYLTGLKAQKEKQEKEKFRQVAAQLENNLAKMREQSDKLGELEERLRQADRLAVIGELTAGLAHEVRNPLGAIRGAVEILRDEIPASEKSAEFFQILIDETGRLNTVVENYLQYARVQKPQKTIFDVRDILGNAVLLLKRQFRRQGVELKTDWPETECTTRGDPNQLWQVVINLLLNAQQSVSGEGLVTLQVAVTDYDPDPQPVDLPQLTISVSDTGRGMTQEEMENIFRPFYTTRREGSGLGLAIVKRIAEENGWKINVRSERNQGTHVSLQMKRELTV